MSAWRVANSLVTLRNQINSMFPGRNKASDGTIGDAAHQAQVSDHNPDKQGIVRALDVTHDPEHGCDIDILSDMLAATRDDRISYIIANGCILSGATGIDPWRWRPYHGSDPHTNHLHLSVVADERGDDGRQWALNTNQRSNNVRLHPDDLKAIVQNVTSALSRGAWRDGFNDETFDSPYRGGVSLASVYGLLENVIEQQRNTTVGELSDEQISIITERVARVMLEQIDRIADQIGAAGDALSTLNDEPERS
jgi:hypothetical protein